VSAMERVRARVPLPPGAIAIGVGLVIAGLSQYGFLAIASHALGKDHYSPLANFWAALFVCAPGFFLPLEQEVGRALAARRARGQGGRPLVVRASAAGAGIAGALIVVTLAISGVLTSRFFDGDSVFVWALVFGFAAYTIQFLVRGTLAGNGRFLPYGSLLAIEGVLRVLLCALLAVLALKVAGVYGLALIAASGVAAGAVIVGRRGLLRPGPAAAWSEISSALGYLLVASVMTQFLLSVGTLAVGLLASAAQKSAAGSFLDSRIVAYVPIFLFQAIQFALLPRLSALAASGRHAEFRKVLLELLLLVTGLGVIATIGLTLLGPFITSTLFGKAFALDHRDFLLLAASCSVFMIAQVLSQALISLRGYMQAAASWLSGAVVFVAVTAIGSDLFLRVELALLVASLATVSVMAALLAGLLRTRAARTDAAGAVTATAQAAKT